MKKVKSFLSKINRRALTGIFCLVAGICFIAFSGTLFNTFIRIVGALVVIAAALKFIHAAKTYAEGAVMTVEIINSVLLFLLGAVMLLSPGGTLRLIYVVIGAYLMINAFTHVYRFALSPKRPESVVWWAEITTSAIILVLGFWLAFSPNEASRLTEIVAGISLLVKSLELFSTAKQHAKSSAQKRKKEEIEGDFIDKSHEL